MIYLISLVNTIIFLLLALLHVYWAIGGKWALEAAIPTALQAPYQTYSIMMKLSTIIVAIGLFAFSLIASLSYKNFFGINVPPIWITRVTVIIGFIFLARAIGDFNYCGLFRKIKEGVFAESDRKIYTPLCFYLGLSMLFLAHSY